MTQTDQTQVPTAPETTISPEELAAFRAYQARIQRDQRDKELRDTYAQLVDDEIDAATDMLTQLSTDMATIKETVMSNFRSVIDMKTETLGLSKPQGQYTHTFTNSDSTRRITIGNYTIDSYRDTVEDGIQLVTTYIQSLARDQDSQALVKAVMQLLSRNSKGQIKASRVLQLRKIAEEVGDPQFIRGVQIIQDSYQPEISRSFVRLEVKDPSTQTWTIVPLNISNL
jgi:Mg2+ and Co2+ transporter CorA